MHKTEVTVINPLGLHARAAAQLVKRASQFRSSVTLAKVGSEAPTANARSILSVLSLAASAGSVLEVAAEGDDSELALAAIRELFAKGFGEV